jgi:hypothetical protein
MEQSSIVSKTVVKINGRWSKDRMNCLNVFDTVYAPRYVIVVFLTFCYLTKNKIEKLYNTYSQESITSHQK